MTARRRAAVAAAVAAALASPAGADPLRLRLAFEAGPEVDTNPAREESPDGTISTPAAAVARSGARLMLARRLSSRHTLALSAVGAVKKFMGAAGVEGEDVAVVTADGRWDIAGKTRPLVFTLRAGYYEAFERDDFDDAGRSLDRDFRTGDASVGLTLLGDAGDRVVGAVGYRLFDYKPIDPSNPRREKELDFHGESAQLVWSHPLGGDDEEPAAWELEVSYAAHRRRFDGPSLTNVCPDGGQAVTCRRPTPLPRVDLFHQAAVELTYTGAKLIGGRYELHVNDSTSFGESLVRHRLELLLTTELLADAFLTAKLVLQFNQFLDTLLVSGDTGTFLTIEDESRNALILHATRDFGEAFTLEARYALYMSQFVTSEELRYRRQTFYVGGIYRFLTAGP